MINTLTLLSLLKPTCIFLYNRKRLIYLLTIPILVLAAIMILVGFFPPVFLAETVEPSIGVNFYIIFVIAGGGGFLLLSVMLRVQQLVFFAEEKPEKIFFIPKFSKELWQYTRICFLVAFCALFLSVLATLVVIAVVQHFFPISEWVGILFLMGTVLFFPYFFVRFILKIPAVVAGQAIGWQEAWEKTSSINIVLATLFALFWFVSMAVVVGVYMAIYKVLGQEAATWFINSFGLAFIFLFSTVLMSTYCGYLFSVVSSKN